jgi:hypothetical protein
MESSGASGSAPVRFNTATLRHRQEGTLAIRNLAQTAAQQTPVQHLMSQMVPMTEHPDLPGYLRTAEQGLRNAADALQPNSQGDVSRNALKQFSRALNTYQTQAANFLNQAANNGTAKTDPSFKGAAANVVAAVVANIGFSVPAGVYMMSKLAAERDGATPDTANRFAEQMFAFSVGMLNGVTGVAATKTRHALGGTTPSYHLAPSNQSTVGPYQKIAGDFLEAAGSTVLYSLARAAMVYKVPEPGQEANEYARAFAAAAGIAAASAMITGVVKESVLGITASSTTSRNNADTAAELPLATRNRSFARGVTLNEVKNPLSNLSFGNTKFKALMTDVVSGIAGAAGLYGVNNKLRNADANHFGAQFGKVLAAFLVFFALKAAAKAVATFMGQHPGAHASSFAKSSQDILVRELQASTLTEMRGALNSLAETLELAPATNRMAQDFHLAREALSGAPLRTGDGDAFVRMAARLDVLAERIAGSEQPDPDRVRLNLSISGDTVSAQVRAVSQEDREVADALRGAARSFRTANDYLAGGSPTQQVEAGILPPSIPEIFLTDAQRKIYDALAVVVSVTNTEGSDEANPSPGVASLAPLLPLFAALQREESKPDLAALMTDLLEVKAPGEVAGNRLRSIIKSTDPASRRVHDRLAEGGVHGLSPKAVVNYAIETQQSPAGLRRAVESAMANIKSPDRFAEARFMILQNLIAQIAPAPLGTPAGEPLGTPAGEPLGLDPPLDHPAMAQARELVAEMRNSLAVPIYVEHARDAAVEAFREGEVHAKHLAHAIREAMEVMDAPVADGEPVPRFTGADLRKAFDPVAVDVLLRTYPAEGGQPNLDASVNQVFESIGASLAHMDGDQKAVFDAASKLNRVFDKAQIEVIKQRDAHYHPSNYNGLINSLILLVDHMNAHGIEHTNAAGIPSQLAHKSAKDQYYAAVVPDSTMRAVKGLFGVNAFPQAGLRYRSHDEALTAEYKTNLGQPLDLSARIGLSITGFDVTDGPYIAENIDQKMLAHPGVFKSVGEVTLIKEIVSGLQEESPRIDSRATKEMFHACSDRGLPLVLHCDRGVAGNKNKYTADVIKMIKDWVAEVHDGNRLHRPDPLADKIRVNGNLPAGFPERQVKVCWAHAAGVSRFTAEGNDHTRQLSELLSTPELDGHLFVDLSWDFVAHDVLQNTQDLLLKNADTPALKEAVLPITKALDAMIKSYKTFAQVGGQADKAQDLGDFTLSAVHRLTASRVAQHHLNQVASFKGVVSDALAANPALTTRLLDLVQVHGDRGNNWLNLLFEHRDKIMFGTDALAIGTKAHGEAAYAINTKTLYPLYHIFQALADRVEQDGATQPPPAGIAAVQMQPAPQPEQLRAVVDYVARLTYEDFFQDPAMEARRTLHEWMLQREGHSWSAGTTSDRIAPGGDLMGKALRSPETVGQVLPPRSEIAQAEASGSTAVRLATEQTPVDATLLGVPRRRRVTQQTPQPTNAPNGSPFPQDTFDDALFDDGLAGMFRPAYRHQHTPECDH